MAAVFDLVHHVSLVEVRRDLFEELVECPVAALIETVIVWLGRVGVKVPSGRGLALSRVAAERAPEIVLPWSHLLEPLDAVTEQGCIVVSEVYHTEWTSEV